MSPRAATVAVVDDDFSSREAIATLLAAFGFTIIEFASGAAYLERGVQEAPACVVLDVHMPGMSGLEVQARLRLLGETAPIVFVSAVDEPAIRQRALAAGAAFWLAKPCDPLELVDSVRRALNRRTRPARL